MDKPPFLYLLPATLILAIGLFFGSALGTASTIDPMAIPISTAEPVISKPTPVKTKIVQQKVNVPSSACSAALATAETGFAYSTKRAEQYETALDHVKSYDWYETSAALKKIQKINKKFAKLYPEYKQAQLTCQGSDISQ